MKSTMPIVLLLMSTTGLAHAQTQPATTAPARKIDQYLINGRVIDATTTRPIEKFTLVLRPAKNPFWQPHTLKRHANGTFKFPHPRGWNDILIRVWAKGYKPLVVRVAEDQDEVEVWLKPAQSIKGRVIGADGKALAGAQVALAGLSQEVRISGGKLALADICRELDRKTVQSAANGMFELPDDPEASKVVVVHESGYGEIELSRIEDGIVVQPWARVQGLLLRGASPAPGWEITVDRASPLGADNPFIHHNSAARTDAAGRFSVLSVAPGRGRVSVNLVKGKNTSSVFGIDTWIDAAPGESVELTLGGVGRPVVGKLVAANGASVDWAKFKLRVYLEAPSMGFIVESNVEDGFREAQGAFLAGGLTSKYHHELTPAADGTFRIERLPQGNYQIAGFPRGFEVKPMEGGRSEEPLELGELKMEPQK